MNLDDVKVPQELIGKAYAFGVFVALMSLLADSTILYIIAIGVLVWTFISDNDPANHEDPPGTAYMDRDGRPVARGDDAV